MPRLPPALWLLGLAVAVSHLTREPAPRPRPVALRAASQAPEADRPTAAR